MNERLKDKISRLPEKPGIYQFFDNAGVIIYVGKAKRLKRRVASYFVESKQHSGKIRVMVRKITDLHHIVVDTETDALLLENNLIKTHQPRYNVLLKDDKTYPWICIKNEDFPRVFKTRTKFNDGSIYFGPYTSVYSLKIVLELVQKLYKIRTCKLALTPHSIAQGKYQTCLENDIGNCLAPCIGNQSLEEYRKTIDGVKHILRGNITSLKKDLTAQMHAFAEDLKFEKAAEIKEKVDIVSKHQSKSVVVSPTITNVDVFAIASDEKYAYVNYFRIIDGAIIQTYHIEVKKSLEESDAEILQVAIIEIRNTLKSNSKEIIVPYEIEYSIPNSYFTIPQRGDKLHVLELCTKNAKYIRIEKLKQRTKLNTSQRKLKIVQQIKDDLQLKKLPQHIECFDNSNIQGTNPVAACVVFRDGKPYKKDYRHFNIKTVIGPDDFASMKEVLFRRYKRLLEEKTPLPQLIVIDGGKGQLSHAMEALNELPIPYEQQPEVIGIAKRLEEIFKPGDPVPLYIDKNSPSLKTIQHLRDEAHRFGITFHRNQRSKNFIDSELESIPGIGPKTIELLFKQFGSISGILSASESDITALVGKKKYLSLRNGLKKS